MIEVEKFGNQPIGGISANFDRFYGKVGLWKNLWKLCITF